MARRRPQNPLRYRSWVIGKSAAEIYAAIAKCIDVIAEEIEPWRTDLVEYNRQSLLLLFPKPEPPPRALEQGLRFGVWQQIAVYYWNKPYRSPQGEEEWLPRIAYTGRPWEVGPSEIHLMDLRPEQLRAALRAPDTRRGFEVAPEMSRQLAAARASTPIEQRLAVITQPLIELVKSVLQFDPVRMFYSPIVTFTLAELIKTMHGARDAEEKTLAIDAFRDLCESVVPDLAQHHFWDDERYFELRRHYAEQLRMACGLLKGLRAHGAATPGLLGQAKDWLRQPTLEPEDLLDWLRRPISPRTLALAALSSRRQLSPDRLTDLLGDARRVRKIRRAWIRFAAFAATQDPSGRVAVVLRSPAR